MIVFLVDVTEIFRASPQQLVFASLWMTGGLLWMTLREFFFEGFEEG